MLLHSVLYTHDIKVHFFCAVAKEPFVKDHRQAVAELKAEREAQAARPRAHRPSKKVKNGMRLGRL